MPTSENIAHQAEMTAREALTRIERHEEECGRRYGDIASRQQDSANSMLRVNERLDQLIAIGRGILGSAMLLLLGEVVRLMGAHLPH